LLFLVFKVGVKLASSLNLARFIFCLPTLECNLCCFFNTFFDEVRM